MRFRIWLLALVALVVALAAPAAQARDSLIRPVPKWYTHAFERKVVDAGAQGVQVPADELNLECPGIAGRGVSAGGCIVAPAGCTANFVFTDGSAKYIGTARHCVDNVGDPLVMQVDTTTLAAVGNVVKVTPGSPELDHDFALVKIDPAVESKWGVNPAIPIVGGPKGIYDGCDAQLVKYYGHGYAVAVAQGKPEAGLATNWLRDSYGWTGIGLPGDSGSGVVLADGRAAGNLTELIVDIGGYPGSNLAGMRATAIMQFLGNGFKLVNADGSTSTSGASRCTATGLSAKGTQLSGTRHGRKHERKHRDADQGGGGGGRGGLLGGLLGKLGL